MTSRHERPWYHDVRHYTLLEFSQVKQKCPEGVYITLKQGDLTRWHGVLFVRKGPYSPAVLRFQIFFPADYPFIAPVVTFTSDIFHPLVTPLTTYTYTTGSTGSETVSATDGERLPPGGLSLGHGFPHWFGRPLTSEDSSAVSSRKASGLDQDTLIQEKNTLHKQDGGETFEIDAIPEPSPPFHSELSGLLVGPNTRPTPPSVIDLLQYIKRIFSEEMVLDNLPLEAAGNAGAWKAWRAYRVSKGAKFHEALSTTADLQSEEWNWDGVWEERVRRGIDSSISDSILFGSTGNPPDLIRFGAMEPTLIDEVRATIIGESSAQ